MEKIRKKLFKFGRWGIPVILFLVGALGFGGWYVWQSKRVSEYERLTQYISGFESIPESAREPVYEEYKGALAYCAELDNSPGVTVLRVVREDFIYFGVGCRGGARTIFAKYNNVWQEIWGGQEPPSCQVIDKYKISKEIEKYCWDLQLQQAREVTYP